MAQREHIADRISSRQRNGHRANHAGVDQRDCEEGARQMSGMSANARRDSRNILETDGLGVSGEGRGSQSMIATTLTIISAMPIPRSARS